MPALTLLTGANGFFGRAIASQFIAAECRLRTTGFPPQNAEGLPDFRPLDLARETDYRALVQGEACGSRRRYRSQTCTRGDRSRDVF